MFLKCCYDGNKKKKEIEMKDIKLSLMNEKKTSKVAALAGTTLPHYHYAYRLFLYQKVAIIYMAKRLLWTTFEASV